MNSKPKTANQRPFTKSPSKPKRLEGFLKWETEAPRLKKELGLGSALGRLVEYLGYGERLSEQKAVEIWAEVVGPKIAEMTQAVSIKDGTLKVKVANASWKQELFYLSDEIRVRLNAALGRELVSKIHFS